MQNRLWSLLFALCFTTFIASPKAHAEMYFPYILANIPTQSVDDGIKQVSSRLTAAGFEIAGHYQVHKEAKVLIATSREQKALATKSEQGGFGVATRISVTAVNGTVQIAYTDPRWMSHIYRLESDGIPLLNRLTAALGNQNSFGSATGIEKDRLRKYQYMIFMPDFTDQVELAEHGDHASALAAVEAGLLKGMGGTAKIYRIDIPGKEESLFGVACKQGEAADQAIMKIIDKGEMKHTAHLPYDILVSGGKVLMLHGKFRIAQSFPDLGMGTFMEISSAPDAIAETLTKVASGS
ncbi:hypothetical protein [Magnetococcus sp. PR-3]|uniref:hypothetical protein n=1 Tax=Magnetococcus sp. PR-3 TaxID=3120355 RepID=UPI002FCE4046